MKQIDLSLLDREQIAKVLKTRVDYKQIELAGEKRHFYNGGLTYDLAKAEGIDLDEVTKAMEPDPEKGMDGEALLRFYDAMTWFLYLGMKPFETAMEPAEIKLEIASMGKDELSAFTSQFQGAEAPSDEGKAGNAPAGEDEDAPREDIPRKSTPPEKSSSETATASASKTTVSAALKSSPSD